MSSGTQRTLAVAGSLFALVPLLVACTSPSSTLPSLDPTPAAAQDTPSDSLRDYAIRRSLRDARIYRDQGRLEAALRATERGLDTAPDEPRLLRLHADLLEALGREEEAARHRARADALDPPLPPLADNPLAAAAAGELLVLLLPPPAEDDPRSPSRLERIPQDWPDDPTAETLRKRLALRLPDAQIVLLDRTRMQEELGSVAAVRSFLGDRGRPRALTLRVDRAFCGNSVEQGDWAVAWLRVASAARGQASARVENLRRALEGPATCKSEAIARALESALEQPGVQGLLGRDPADGNWSNASIRGLFPDLGLALGREIEAGRRQLAGGNLAAAEEHFQRAVAIDPGDLDASSFLEEVELALALSRELSRPASERPGERG
ncbi:MAG: hypothetical protein JRH19_24595, partial [Deltaproteobacteria bacterium]|nr:hypothetical protein [Deltaproteobacteria bacterium]